MSDAPQLYLIAPTGPVSQYTDALGPILDLWPVSCIRLPALPDEAEMGRRADVLRDMAHARDIAVVIDDHPRLAQAHGLDGVHLTQAGRGLREARKLLGADAIVGAYAAGQRHDGISAAEAGADYVSFGPMRETALGLGEPASIELIEWWAEMIEVPLVVEGALDAEMVAVLQRHADFIAIGQEIWEKDDPQKALEALWPGLR